MSPHSTLPPVRVVGPRDPRVIGVINTTSKSPAAWTTELSPFHLGPITLPDGRTAKRLENAWQYAKVYPIHLSPKGNILPQYFAWSNEGFNNSFAVRYPMGKGAKPAFSLLGEERLSYIEARHRIYWVIYRDAVAKTAAFKRLEMIHRSGEPLSLFDFDGYDHLAQGKSLRQVAFDPNRIMGHAFVLAAMLEHGTTISPEQLPN